MTIEDNVEHEVHAAEVSDIISDEELLGASKEVILFKLQTTESGLSQKEAGERLDKFGRNEVVKRKKNAGIVKFLSYFKNPLIIILILAGTITAFTGETVSSIIIYAIVLLSISLMYVQEFRAERASEDLSKRVAITASALRDGNKTEVPLWQLVPGDIIFLTVGDIVPAEARILHSKDLFIDQSALTGESFAAEKLPGPLPRDKLGDRNEWSNYLFMGTSVLSGSATAVVTKTGSHTEYAGIVEKLVGKRPETEFERGSRRFGLLIMEITIVLVLFVFLVNALTHRSLLESLLFSVALAVGLTPELLPMILTINLSKGALDMSKKGVIVKRLESIQNYGSMDVLCADKTGTLTENRVALVKYVDPQGKDADKVLQLSYLNSNFGTGIKSPLDGAIIAHGGVDMTGYEKLDEIPFDFVRRRVSVAVRKGTVGMLTTKGAPEEMLKMCSRYEIDGQIKALDEGSRTSILKLYTELSADGLRSLGVAYKEFGTDKTTFSMEDENDLIYAGFVAFLDPPKESSKESIRLLKRSGIEMKIITGDSELVTKKVCEELGFDITGIVLGKELEGLDPAKLKLMVERANIFARVTPTQKNDIIVALKSNGHVVGFMGDGVNDAPSIRAADVGISVENAVDVAKESADIILLKNDLRVLNDGVLDGRKTFGNTMKYILMGISSNFGNMFSAAGASLFLPFLPMLPLQILLNNLMYDLSETTIPTDNVDKEYLEKAKRLNIRFIRDFMIFFGPISSLYDFLTFFVLIYFFHATDHLFQTAWFIESIATQTLVIFAIRTRITPFWKSRPSIPLVISSVVVVAFALVVPFTPLAGPFNFVPLPPSFYAVLVVFVISYLALVDVLKILFYRRHTQDLIRESEPEVTGARTAEA